MTPAKLQEIKDNAPDGATHYYVGTGGFHAHYQREDSDGNTFYWNRDRWNNTSWGSPPLSECIDLREPIKPCPCPRCAELVEVLEDVNKMIFATTTYLGSPEYFEIRRILCDAVANHKETTHDHTN